MLKSEFGEQIVDGIYESAINPDQWPEVLEKIARASDSLGGVIFCLPADQGLPRFRTTPQIAPMAHEFVQSGFFRESIRVKMAFIDPFPEFKPTRSDAISPELETDITTRMLAQVGLGEESTAHIAMPTGDVVAVGIQKAYGCPVHDAAQLGSLNLLLPHLSRATMIASRLRMEVARSTVALLGLLAIPACILARDGKELASNDLFGALSGIHVPRAFGRVGLVDPVANDLFQKALEALAMDRLPPACSIPIQKTAISDPAVVHLLPLRRSARDILSTGDILFVITTPSPKGRASSPNLLAALFDLTPAQARTAAALADGVSVQGIAASLGITEKTVRTYIERIFAKTGARRLSDLLVLLGHFRQ